MPRFSIVIPCYNNVDTVDAAIGSALAQRYSDYSVIVCDNASTDGSAERIARHTSERLTTALCTDHLSKTANWNRAYTSAPDCDYLVTLHADDLLDPECLGTIADNIGKRPSLIHGGANYIDGADVEYGRTRFRFPYSAGCSDFRKITLLHNIVVVAGVAMRTDAFHAISYWPVEWTFMQDVEAWWRLAAIGNVRYTPRNLGSYRSGHFVRSPLPQLIETIRWQAEKVNLCTDAGLQACALAGLARSCRDARSILRTTGKSSGDDLSRLMSDADEVLRERGFSGDRAFRKQRWLRLSLAARSAFFG